MTDERAALYRTLADGRRMLVVLDNAATVEQVRPLLPGSPSCMVIVTSRNSLAGLVARHGARRLELDLLTPGDAVGLLRALIGDRVAAEPDAAATLAGQCAYLPLALRVAAEFAAARPDMSLAGLVGELTDQQRRLDLLDADSDPRTAVRSVFSWSYQNLPAGAARAFRLLGLHPGPDFDAYGAAALMAVTLDESRRFLGLLTRAHLIHPARPGRCGLHDLLRAYAVDLADAEDRAGDGRAALTRLFDYYLATAASAMNTLVPAERHRRPPISPSAAPAPPMTDPAAARSWLDTERSTLVAVTAHTAADGWPTHTTRLAATLFRYLGIGGHYTEAATIHGHARRAASLTGDCAAEATALTNLGIVTWRQGHYADAAGHYQQALALFREIGDRSGEARALGNLGSVAWRQSSYQQAAGHYQQALTLFRKTGDTAGEATALGNLGFVYERQGRYADAAGYHQRAMVLFRSIGDRSGEARALGNLGAVYQRQGHYADAAAHYQRSLALFRETGDRSGEANALTDLGVVHWRQGRHKQAGEHHHHALALFREIGEGAGEAEALNGIGEVLLAIGLHAQAQAQHTAALALADKIGDKYEQARAHDGLGHTYRATAHLHQARDHWQQALTCYTDLGLPEADDVRARLAALDNGSPAGTVRSLGG